MTYMVLDSNNCQVLADNIQKHIQQGWVPLGGISITSHKGMIWFAQAMIKEKP